MADKETQDDKSTEKVEQSKGNKNKTILIAGSVIGVVLVGGIIAAAVVFGTFTGMHRGLPMAQFNEGGNPGFGQQSEQAPRHRGGFNRQMMDSANFVTGVVISINGDSFVVAGNGKQVTVNKTASTTFQGTSSDAVAVNDSVTVVGTTTNNVLSATEITIRNIASE